MYEYKSLKERMEECEDEFVDALFESPLFNNGHKDKKIDDIHTSIKDEDIDILPF